MQNQDPEHFGVGNLTNWDSTNIAGLNQQARASVPLQLNGSGAVAQNFCSTVEDGQTVRDSLWRQLSQEQSGSRMSQNLYGEYMVSYIRLFRLMFKRSGNVAVSICL